MKPLSNRAIETDAMSARLPLALTCAAHRGRLGRWAMSQR